MPLLRPLVLAVLVLAASAGHGGCADSGGLSIRLALPAADELSPANDDLIAELTLEARSADGNVQRLSRSLNDAAQGLSLGSLEPGESLSIALELRSVGKQLLGYGRSPAPIEIKSGSDTEVTLNVRRPLAYLPNRTGVLFAVDASRDLSSALSTEISVSGTPIATATSLDGGDLFVALSSGAASSLALVSTSTHLPSRELAGGLRPAPADLVISSDGVYAALAHRTQPGALLGGVSVIEIASGEVTFVELGDVSRVAIDSIGTLYALAERSPRCIVPARTATIFRLSLGDLEVRSTLAFAGSAGDIAIGQDDQVLVADPCAGVVSRVAAGGDSFEPFVSQAGASALAATADAILVAGFGDAVALTVTTLELNGELINTVELPTPTESAVAIDLDQEGQSISVVAEADVAAVLDLAAVPGSNNFVILTEASYDIERGAGIPDITATAWEYQLVDATSETAVHRIRSACDLVATPIGTDIVNWICGQSTDQVVLEPEFRIETISVLYGAR